LSELSLSLLLARGSHLELPFSLSENFIDEDEVSPLAAVLATNTTLTELKWVPCFLFVVMPQPF
jgi:hypothetical protein